jgi:hypothetical protein
MGYLMCMYSDEYKDVKEEILTDEEVCLLQEESKEE